MRRKPSVIAREGSFGVEGELENLGVTVQVQNKVSEGSASVDADAKAMGRGDSRLTCAVRKGGLPPLSFLSLITTLISEQKRRLCRLPCSKARLTVKQ